MNNKEGPSSGDQEEGSSDTNPVEDSEETLSDNSFDREDLIFQAIIGLITKENLAKRLVEPTVLQERRRNLLEDVTYTALISDQEGEESQSDDQSAYAVTNPPVASPAKSANGKQTKKRVRSN